MADQVLLLPQKSNADGPFRPSPSPLALRCTFRFWSALIEMGFCLFWLTEQHACPPQTQSLPIVAATPARQKELSCWGTVCPSGLGS